MTLTVEQRGQLLIELARKLWVANPDFDLGSVVRIVCAADLADELDDIKNNIAK
jgi:hypothetical protein